MSILKKFSNKLSEEAQILKGEKGLNKTYHSFKAYSNEQEAKNIFTRQAEKFLNISTWDQFSGPENASFKHYDASAAPITNDKVNVGDYISIDLPGPLPIYWVRVEKVIIEPELVNITVRPSEDPTSSNTEKTKHFFTDDATSAFILERKGKELHAYEIGKNEVINNNEKAGAEAPINTAVATGGWAGIQAHQWNTFTRNLVEKIEF
ncbi:MAG TPA: hypothetical protein VF691_18050 [Cytophagaceae bacterium]|jgi:hypothetical protein